MPQCSGRGWGGLWGWGCPSVTWSRGWPVALHWGCAHPVANNDPCPAHARGHQVLLLPSGTWFDEPSATQCHSVSLSVTQAQLGWFAQCWGMQQNLFCGKKGVTAQATPGRVAPRPSVSLLSKVLGPGTGSSPRTQGTWSCCSMLKTTSFCSRGWEMMLKLERSPNQQYQFDAPPITGRGVIGHSGTRTGDTWYQTYICFL